MTDTAIAEAAINPNLRLGIIIGLSVILTLIVSRGIPMLIRRLIKRFSSPADTQSNGAGAIAKTQPYSSSPSSSKDSLLTRVIAPHRGLVILTVALLVIELGVLLVPRYSWYPFLEVPISLALAIAISWLGSRLFKQFFDIYLRDAAMREGRKLNSEILILAKFSANAIIVIVTVILFAQTHDINVFGIIASLGIGGLAVAFAAQKTLEQFLGGIVIYVDRPFVIDDYIGLPDGTFGKVESIGLRSTKIRTSGKGTLMIVPNSALTQINIENFTGAKKVMSILYLNMHQKVPDEERALIRQVILESTKDIFGIDSRSSDVMFRPMPHERDRTQVQVTFFILGSGEVSMDLRRQLLDIATQSINQRLKEYGVAFDIEDPTIYVDSPITI
ncbi:MAG: mechanosensitive ion channel family protein [Elainellaceae cyanobacterium]